MKPLQEIVKKDKLVLVLLTGLLLLIIAMPVKNRTEEADSREQVKEADRQEISADSWQTRMEKRLTEVLEKVNGVGKAEVFLTCQSTEKKIVEKDETDTVYEKDAKGNQLPYVASEEYPRVTGVLVVAQGGDEPIVIQNIREAVEALFQVEPHKIKVMKMN